MKDTEVEKTIDVVLSNQPTIYGVRRKLDEETTTWERLEGAETLCANAQKSSQPVENDFDNISPWKDIKSCDVLPNGTVNAYIGENDYDPVNPKGYIMTEVPSFYYKREQTGGYEYIYISPKQEAGYIKTDKFYIGRYTITGEKTTISCKSGLTNLTNISLTDLRTQANNIGEGWGQLDILRISLIQMLYLVEYANYNSQETLGTGVTSGSSVVNTGTLDMLKMKSGCLADDKFNAVIYRGIENIYGNINQWCDGITVNSYQTYICYDRTQYKSDKYTDPYKALSFSDPQSGYIKTMGYDESHPLIQRAIEIGGNSSTYCPDHISSLSGLYSIQFGGCVGQGTYCGLWDTTCTKSTVESNTLGGRLVYIPEQI